MYPPEFLLLNSRFGCAVARPMRSPDIPGFLKIDHVGTVLQRRHPTHGQVVCCKGSFDQLKTAPRLPEGELDL